MIRSLLVPLDGSPSAENALCAAAALALKLNAGVTLLHLIERGRPAQVHGQRHLSSEQEAQAYLEYAAKSFPGAVLVTRHVHEQDTDSVAAGILFHSQEYRPDLIVMAVHRRGELRGWLAGTLAQRVLSGATAPVLMVQPLQKQSRRGTADPCGFSRILIALDGDPRHEAGLTVAEELAATAGAAVRFVGVVPTAGTLSPKNAAIGALLPGTTRAMLDAEEEHLQKYLNDRAAGFLKRGVTVSCEVRRGDPARQIGAAAKRNDADLIVLGTHGKSGLKAFWAASVAKQVIEKTHAAVLLAPVTIH